MTKLEKRKKKKPKKPKSKNGFKYEADLIGCEEYIASHYSAPTQPLYRWVKSPVQDVDFVPQHYLENKESDIADLEMEASVKHRVERNTTSMYISEESSIKTYRSIIERLEKKDKKEDNDPDSGHKARFMDRCGQFNARIILTEDDAVVGEPNPKGHVDVILKKGFDYQKSLDTTYKLKNMLDDEEVS